MSPRWWILSLAAIAALQLAAGWRDHHAAVAYAQARAELTWRQAEIIHVRGQVHACQQRLGLHRSPVGQRVVTGGKPYRAWVLRRWRGRRELCYALERKLADPVQAILAVFGPYGWQAVEVARCETGGTFSVWARNGQYENLFQMGYRERRLYGWHTAGSSPLVAARAAHRYFLASGSDWSPWECKP